MQADSEKSLGGFFELETFATPLRLHQQAAALSTGRSCLAAFLRYVRPGCMVVPEYTCNAVFDAFHAADVPLRTYQLNADLSPRDALPLQPDECLLLTNYFGLQRPLIEEYGRRFNDRILIDNTHDFFSGPPHATCWAFTSARKWFGVPDGAFFYVPDGIPLEDVLPPDAAPFRDISLAHSLLRLTHPEQLHDGRALTLYRSYEQSLPCRVDLISAYSRSVLGQIPFEAVAARRRDNFACLHEALGGQNVLSWESPGADTVPFAYPYLPSNPIPHSALHPEQIFVPRLWSDVCHRTGVRCQTALQYSEQLLALPIDHRYSVRDMARIIDTIRRLEGRA